MLLTPNMLSIFRLCLVPLFVVLTLSGLRYAHL
jgi:phosphatidylglycerophosphate synthase